MSLTVTPPSAAAPDASVPSKKRIRYSVLTLLAVVLAFYFGFMALLVFRSHH
jgi:hypothetical protein